MANAWKTVKSWEQNSLKIVPTLAQMTRKCIHMKTIQNDVLFQHTLKHKNRNLAPK